MSRETVNVYIGADNTTHKIDLDLVSKIVSRDVEGFTIWPARGYWHGEAEESAVITIDADSADIDHVVSDLRTELAQDAVGLQHAEPIMLSTGEGMPA